MIDYKKKYLKYKKKYLQIKKIYGGMESNQLGETPESDKNRPFNSPITYELLKEFEKLDKKNTDDGSKNEKLEDIDVPKFTNKIIKGKRKRDDSKHVLAQISADFGPLEPVKIVSERFLAQTNIEQKKPKKPKFSSSKNSAFSLKNSVITQINNDETDDNKTDDETDDKIVENEILQLEDKKIEKINNQFKILTEIESIIAEELEKGEINSKYLKDLEDLFLIIKLTSLDFNVEKEKKNLEEIKKNLEEVKKNVEEILENDEIKKTEFSKRIKKKTARLSLDEL